jgi:hypothetical protein
VGLIACTGEKKSACGILMGIPEGERETLQRHEHRWEDIKMDLQEEGCELMDWIHLAQNRDKLHALMSTAMHLWVS